MSIRIIHGVYKATYTWRCPFCHGGTPSYHPLGDERPKDKKAADTSPSDTSLVPRDPMVELDLVSWLEQDFSSPLDVYVYIYILVGGLEHKFYDFPETVGNFIIPTDELIFFRGVETTNQYNYTMLLVYWLSAIMLVYNEIMLFVDVYGL